MSHIGFRSLEDEAEVGGRERANCAVMIAHLTTTIADIEYRDQLEGMLDRDKFFSVLGLSPIHQHILKYLFGTHHDTTKLGDGTWNCFTTSLNTILVIGSDALKFVARVHAQCEIHGYVEGPNRAWLANIIEKGIETGILRKETQGYGKGWEDVITLLRSTDNGPVVMDYSVTDSFPSYPGEEKHTCVDDELECVACKNKEAWYELSHEERWNQALAKLRTNDAGLEMKPDNWNDYYFGDGLTVFDFVETLRTLMKS